MDRAMQCLRADGTLLETRRVSTMKRYSMQAASDHRAADKAKADLGADLHHVTFTPNGVTLHFDARGQSQYLMGR